MPVSDMYGGRAGFMKSGRPFEGALSATDDQTPLPSQFLEIDLIARMRKTSQRQALDQLRGQVLEGLEADGDDDVFGSDDPAIIERCLKAILIADMTEPADQDR